MWCCYHSHLHPQQNQPQFWMGHQSPGSVLWRALVSVFSWDLTATLLEIWGIAPFTWRPMSLWRLSVVEIKLKTLLKILVPCQNWLKVGKTENKVTQKWALSFPPDCVSPVWQQGVCHSGIIYLERAGWVKVILVFIDSMTLALLIRIYGI